MNPGYLLTNVALYNLDNAPVSKALLAITGAASTLNVLFPFFKYQTLIRTGAFSYIQDSKV